MSLHSNQSLVIKFDSKDDYKRRGIKQVLGNNSVIFLSLDGVIPLRVKTYF